MNADTKASLLSAVGVAIPVGIFFFLELPGPVALVATVASALLGFAIQQVRRGRTLAWPLKVVVACVPVLALLAVAYLQ